MKLFPHQERGVQFLRTERRVLLSVDMRLGKTAIVLHHIRATRPKSVIVVGPKRVVDNSWMQEAEKWNMHDLLEQMIICSYSSKKASAALDDASKPIKVVNAEYLHLIKNASVDLLVIDEITLFKSVLAARSQHVRTVKAKQYIGLTGTFLANGAVDIFGQLAALHITRASICMTQPCRSKPKQYCPEFEGWRSTYFENKLAGSGLPFPKWVPHQPLQTILKPFRKHIFTLDAADYNVLAPTTFHLTQVPMSEQERQNYISLSAILQIDMNDEHISIPEEGKFAKLQTICNGFIYDSEGVAIRNKTSSKLEAVADFCLSAANENEPVLLFYAFREEAVWLSELLKARGLKYSSVKDKDFLRKWSNREIDVLFSHPASAYGLNLQYGGRICVWSSITYNFDHWLQANARLIGSGQKKPVDIHVFSAERTIEQRQYLDVTAKQKENDLFKKITKR